MATYRTVNLSFWTDSKVEDDFTPEDKYFFLYLLTNPHTNLCGCYECSAKQMARETGYNEDTVKRLLARMERVHNVILYDEQTKEVLVLNWGKYNWCNSPKTKAGAEKVAAHIKSEPFKKMVLEAIADTLSIPYPYPMDTSVTVLYREDSNTSSTSSQSSKDNNFEIFWKAYPKKKNKETARRAFMKLRGVNLQTLLDAIDRQKNTKDWTKDGGQYIPYPATWLNAGAWQDEELTVTEDRYANLRKLMEETEDD